MLHAKTRHWRVLPRAQGAFTRAWYGSNSEGHPNFALQDCTAKFSLGSFQFLFTNFYFPFRLQGEIGVRDGRVVEHPDAIKAYLVRQESTKIDLAKLARLRFIENMKTPALCGVFGKRRTAIRQSIRTLRKCGVTELNLTEMEKKMIQERIMVENKLYKGKCE